MATFNYTAKDKIGALKRGSLVAPDRAAAASNLMDRGLIPVLIKDAGGGGGTKKGFSLGKLKFGGRVKLQDKVIFSRQFATMINAGVPIVQSLSILAEQASNAKLKAAITDMSKRVEGGSTLSAAMTTHSDIFNGIYINMVKAGETGGLLDEVLERLAIQQEKDAEIVGKVKSAMIYPAVITTATVGAFVFLMVGIVPKLAGIFEGLGSELPWYTKLMLAISSALIHQGIFIAMGVGIAGFLFMRWYRSPKGKKVCDTVLLKAPVVGPIIIKVNVARFARTLGSLMSSGISVLEALNSTASALSNTVFRDNVRAVAAQVKAGKTISEQLRTMHAFPPIVSQMVAVGEETGQLDEILTKLAGFYEKEVDTVIAGITSIIEPILIIVLGGMVGFIVISVFGPISSISNAV